MREAASSKKADVELLSGVSIFSKLSRQDLEELGRLAVFKTWPAEAAICFQGEPSDSMYLLLSGSVKVVETSSEGEPRILGILEHGEFFGELAMLDGQPRSATVTTCETCETASISHVDFRKFVSARPEVMWKVTEALCERVRKTSDDMLEMTSHDVPHRLLTTLTRLCEKHSQRRADGSLLITMKLSLRELAAMVGANTNEVGRYLRQYQQEGLLELGKDRQLIVRDPGALARAVEFSSEWSA